MKFFTKSHIPLFQVKQNTLYIYIYICAYIYIYKHNIYKHNLCIKCIYVYDTSYAVIINYSASVTAVFELEDGTEKSFMRSVQGSSSEHRINNNVSFIYFFS